MAASRSKKKNPGRKPSAKPKPRAAVKTAVTRRTAAAAKPAGKSANPLGLEKKPPGQFDTLQEIALEAWRKMPAPVWDHLMGGSDSEMTLRRNRAGLRARFPAAYRTGPAVSFPGPADWRISPPASLPQQSCG
jgi:hypothetical protein